MLGLRFMVIRHVCQLGFYGLFVCTWFECHLWKKGDALVLSPSLYDMSFYKGNGSRHSFVLLLSAVIELDISREVCLFVLESIVYFVFVIATAFAVSGC